VTRTRVPMPRCLRCRGYVAQCSAGTDRGHSIRTQWPVILTAPCLSQYGVDATPCPVGHSVVSSRRPAEIAGVVDALMGRDALLGDWSRRERRVIAKPASSDTENRCLVRGHTRGASGETENGFLVEASRERPRARRRFVRPSRPPVRGQRRGGEPVGSDGDSGLTNGLPSGFVFYGVEVALSIYARGTPFYGTRQLCLWTAKFP